MDLAAIEERIAAVHRGRRWIVVMDAAVGATARVQELREHGASGVMVVAGIEGVGELPEPDRIHYTRSVAPTMLEGIRAFLAAVEDPSPELLAAVTAFDPDRSAMVYGQGLSRSATLADRPVYGARPRAWRDLEDKTLADDLWSAAGIAHTPAAVVPVDDAPTAARRLASDAGTVWTADNTEGWHGGGAYVRWVPDDTAVADAVAWFSAHARQVRVMPFLEGLPCSIHGFNTGDGTAVFRPMELVILRHADRPAFSYAQGATYWEPPDAITEQMRDAARSVGAVLDDLHGYRGGFGIDGIATPDGFRPTELNPRLSIGHFIHARVAGIPLVDMETLLLAGDLDVSAPALEEAVLEASRTGRGGGMMFGVPEVHPESETGFRIGDGTVSVDVGETPDGTMRIGPSNFGSALIVRFDADRMPVGPSIAPLAPALIGLARTLWGVDMPDLVPAPDPWANPSP